MKGLLKHRMPEEVGIPSEAILDFIEHIKAHGVELHSFWMQQGEKCIAEGYYAPFHQAFQHRMYSVSKSFTSLAIGFLIEEGRLSLKDHICDFFKDKWPEGGVHPYIAAMTIEDLLTMRTAHRLTTYKRYGNGDWVESFFHVSPTHMPGTVFNYDTSSAHVLAALVERLTQMRLLDYLRSKCLNTLGWSKEAYMLKDPAGVSMGGSGLVCTQRELASIAYVCTNEGRFKEQQLIPRDFLKAAVSCQVSTKMQPFLDETYGYGYQIWKNRKGGFTFYGMGGQLALCFPEKRFFMVTTANTIGKPADLQQLYDGFYECIYPYLEHPVWECDLEKQKQLIETINHLQIQPLQGAKKSSWCKIIQDRRYLLEGEILPIHSLQLQLNENGGNVKFWDESGMQMLAFGYEKPVLQMFPHTNLKCMNFGTWLEDDTLMIQSTVIETCLATLKVQLSFKEDQVTLMMKKGIEPFMSSLEGVASGKWDGN